MALIDGQRRALDERLPFTVALTSSLAMGRCSSLEASRWARGLRYELACLGREHGRRSPLGPGAKLVPSANATDSVNDQCATGFADVICP